MGHFWWKIGHLQQDASIIHANIELLYQIPPHLIEMKLVTIDCVSLLMAIDTDGDAL